MREKIKKMLLEGYSDFKIIEELDKINIFSQNYNEIKILEEKLEKYKKQYENEKRKSEAILKRLQYIIKNIEEEIKKLKDKKFES